MNLREKIQESLSKNPLAWLLAIAFVLAEYGNYRKGEDLRRICELLQERLPAGYSTKPRTPMEEVVKICSSHDPDDVPAQ
jgi:hypothetical protein